MGIQKYIIRVLGGLVIVYVVVYCSRGCLMRSTLKSERLGSCSASRAASVAPASAVRRGSSASRTGASGVPSGVGVEEVFKCLRVGGGWRGPVV